MATSRMWYSAPGASPVSGADTVWLLSRLPPAGPAVDWSYSVVDPGPRSLGSRPYWKNAVVVPSGLTVPAARAVDGLGCRRPAGHRRGRGRGDGVVDRRGAGLPVLAGGGDGVGVRAGGGGVERAGPVGGAVGVGAGLDAGPVGVVGAGEGRGNVLAEVEGLAGLGRGDLGGGCSGDGVVDRRGARLPVYG